MRCGLYVVLLLVTVTATVTVIDIEQLVMIRGICGYRKICSSVLLLLLARMCHIHSCDG